MDGGGGAIGGWDVPTRRVVFPPLDALRFFLLQSTVQIGPSPLRSSRRWCGAHPSRMDNPPRRGGRDMECHPRGRNDGQTTGRDVMDLLEPKVRGNQTKQKGRKGKKKKRERDKRCIVAEIPTEENRGRTDLRRSKPNAPRACLQRREAPRDRISNTCERAGERKGNANERKGGNGSNAGEKEMCTLAYGIGSDETKECCSHPCSLTPFACLVARIPRSTRTILKIRLDSRGYLGSAMIAKSHWDNEPCWNENAHAMLVGERSC